MKQRYQRISMAPASRALVDTANEIIAEYRAEGFVLTLRQLYYQFVARDFIENTQRSYKRLGDIVNKGRLAGLIDWDAIEDRTRNLQELGHWSSPRAIVDACAAQFRIDLWARQPTAVEVWIEKEALAGVIAGVCRRYDVPYFSCRGYVSQSEQRKAGLRALERWNERGQGTLIIHLGDHDPSGIDMTRDIADRLDMFSELTACVQVHRIALNMDQIEELQPPPNPAKFTDSRASDYVRRFGPHSWELDALEPRYIERLISRCIRDHMDVALWDEAAEEQQQGRDRIAELARELDE